MMIKVSDEFLEFNDLIEIEKQIKLVEEISTTDGDFSYSFEIPKTIQNTRILGNPMPDNINKPVYQRIPARVLNSDGSEVYNGYLRLERVTNVYECSFFAGNNNWFGMITGTLAELSGLSRFDVDQTVEAIQDSWENTEGLVFPLVDNGGLLTRGYQHLKVEDMVAGLYVKTIFKQIFTEAGIKLQGELLNDWMFNNIVCVKNSKNQAEIDNRSSYVQKNTEQIIPKDATELVTWDNETTYPFYDGSQNNFNLGAGRYTADVKMIVNVSVFFELLPASLVLLNEILLYKNGVQIGVLGSSTEDTITSIGSKSIRVSMEPGDYLEIFFHSESGIGTNDQPILSGTIKITPTYIYKSYGVSTVPNWSQQKFVSNILKLFNCLPSYNPTSKTLTINLFEKIKDKPALDLSENFESIEIDYPEFVSNYGQKSKLSYNEVDFEELKSYNVGKYFRYGQGHINVDNDFIEPEVDIVESDFSNPIAYESNVFAMSMEKLNIIEFDEGEDVEFTGVTDSGAGVARFTITEDIYLVGDLVRITDSLDPLYNGDWVVNAVAAGWVEFDGLGYSADTTGKTAKLEYVYGNSDDVYLLVNIPNYDLTDFTGKEFFMFETVPIIHIALGYFDVINTGRQINQDFIYSLSFGGIDDPQHYQITMTERYFRVFGQVLNDPVKLFAICYLPKYLYERISFLEPITVKTLETTNRYYVNRITGYKESYYPCTMELIKLP